MKKTHYLLLATCFTTAVFANDGGASLKESRDFKDSAEFIEFVDVMPKALENVDLSDPETVVTTALNAFFACEVDVAAYLTYIAPTVHNPQGFREHKKSSLQQECEKIQWMLSGLDIKVLNVDYDDEQTKVIVKTQIVKGRTEDATLFKTPNGWRLED